MRRRAIIGALSLLGLGVALGATVFRADIAHATGLAQTVTVDNTALNPVPVKEQNIDPNAAGAIRVHEEGQISIRPVVPSSPWHRVRIVNTGASAFLTDPPSSSPINITSVTVAENMGGAPTGVTAVLSAFSVPATATDCSGEGAGDTLWASTMVTGPVAVTFPTPLVASAPAGQKICLRASAQGESGDSVWFSLSGFFGSA